MMMTDARCSVCSAPLLNTQKWPATKTRTIRSPSAKRSPSRSKAVVQQTIEDEYIKQLQEQIYVLENENQYLREQLNKHSKIADRTYQVEQERAELQRNLMQTSSQFEQLASEKHGLAVALDELRRKFDVEKQNLLDELENLRRTRATLDQEKRVRDQELRQIREQNRVSSDELKSSHAKVRILEQQFEQQLNQNKILTDDFQRVKIESNHLQRNLTEYQSTARDRDRIVGDLEKEVKTLRQQLKTAEARSNDARDRVNDEKNVLIKEMSRLETLAKGFEREVEELRLALRQHTDALRLKDQELTGLRKKEQTFRSTVDTIQTKFETELTRNQDLDEQLKQTQRELNIEIQKSLTAKRELNEYESRFARLRDEIDLLQQDKEHLISQISLLQTRLTTEESITNKLRMEIEQLEIRVQEIDRLKSMEDLIQSQRWDDITQMARTMQTVSTTMARATSPTLLRKSRLELP